MHASTRTLFFVDERSTEPVPISYLRSKVAVDAAGYPCDKLVFYTLPGSDPPVSIQMCRYAERKPGVATKLIDLSMGTLMLQSHLESSGWIGSNIATIFAGDAAVARRLRSMQPSLGDVGLAGRPRAAPCRTPRTAAISPQFLPRA